MPFARNYSEQRNVFRNSSLFRNPAERVEGVDRFEMSFENVLNDKKEITLLGDFQRLVNFN